MNYSNVFHKSSRLPLKLFKRPASSIFSSKSGEAKASKTTKKPVTNLSQLQNIITNMKVQKNENFFTKLNSFGNSGMFNYATNKQDPGDELKDQKLKVWDKLCKNELQRSCIKLPLNGFEEMIRLTEEGKLWHYPVDNEQGLEAELSVPFEDHVFLDEFLEKFPKNEEIQSVMQLALAGLAKNHSMTVERKHQIIQFYLDYFEEKREMYKLSGYEI